MSREVFPAGACDTHMHIYDARFPAAPTSLLRPPDARCRTTVASRRALGLDRVVIVQPTTYGLDNTCQIEAARRRSALALVSWSSSTSAHPAPSSNASTHSARAAPASTCSRVERVPWSSLAPTAARIADLGWHVQLQTRRAHAAGPPRRTAGAPDRTRGRSRGPLHAARRRRPPGVHRAADAARHRALLGEAVGAVRIDPRRRPALPRRRCARPGALSSATRSGCCGRPTGRTPASPTHPGSTRCAISRRAWLPSTELRQRVLVDNPAALYGFPSPTDPTEPRSPA